MPLAFSGHCLTSLYLLQDAKNFYAELEGENAKRDALFGLKEVIDTGGGNIVFVSSCIKVHLLFEHMRSMGFRVSCVHSDMEQTLRDEIMMEFLSGRTAFLITTHALGCFDVAQFSLVINYDLPTRMDRYIDNVARCGRFGRTKIAINFVTPEDKQTLDLDWSVVCKTRIDAMPDHLSSL
jgi:superfamily II DNA/RNA helicase